MKHSRISNRSIRIALGVILFLILTVSVLLVFNLMDMNRSADEQPERSGNSSVMYVDGSPYTLKSGIETILFIGTDKYESEEIEESSFRNDRQNDFNLLVVIDNKSEEFTPILINRDTMTDVITYSVSGKKSGSVYQQLALAYTYGTGNSDSCINVSEAVSNLLFDVNIEHYAAITLDAIPLLNDAVGGVKLTVLDDLSYVDADMYEGAEITLKGNQAEYYVRSRYGLEDSTNANRMKRQKQYISEWVKLAKQRTKEDLSFADDTIVKINDYLTTDLSVSSLSELSARLSEYSQKPIAELSGTTSVVDNHIQFKPDDASIKEIVLENFYVSAEE